MVLEKIPNAEPIPGYRLISRLGCGGFGEVWKCEAPGGIFKAIKFVYGDLNGFDVDSARAEEELRAVQHIKSIRHPFLLSIDRVESIAGELAIVTELADQNLEELLNQYRNEGAAGIPRAELFSYLREAAEVLDVMNLRHHLQHLDVKPRNLFLVSQHVKVADFGLVNSLSGNAGLHLGAITPLYAAPELFLGKLSQFCDQYSLAISFQELLTGTLPFQGKNARQLLLLHTQGPPNLDALPEADRPIIARALAKDPGQRFPSCMDLLRALMGENAVAPAISPVRPMQNSSSNQANPSSTVETLNDLGQDTEKLRSRASPDVPPQLLEQYRFLECLGSTPLVDLWKVQTADGRNRLLKILYGFSFADAKRLQDVVQQLRSLQHPCLVETDILHGEPGRLIAVTDLIEETLRDRFQQCQARKLPGIMRGELVDYLRAAAEVLDYLYQQHSVQHLNLNPRNLILNNDWLQINEFGLAQLLWLPAGQAVGQRNARYAAPELFDKQVSTSCDQYSLAVIYAEMLTGTHPFRSGVQQSGPARSRQQPELSRLPEQDQEIIARALSLDPAQRWRSCSAMVEALEGTNQEILEKLQEKQDRFDAFLKAPRSKLTPLPAGTSTGDLNQIITDIIAAAAGHALPQEDLPVLEQTEEVIHHKFQVGLPLGSARLKLESFCQQWYGQLKRDDERGFVVHVNMPSNFWRQWIGRQPGLEIAIQLARVQPMSPTPIEVRTQIRAFRCSRRRGLDLLQEMGPALLDSLRKILLVNSEKRTQERILWPHALKVIPLDQYGAHGEVIDCRGKDISMSGIGFYLPHEIDASDVLIQLPNTLHPPYIAVPATMVRARPCADGWYEVGALFRLPALRKSSSEFCIKGEM